MAMGHCLLPSADYYFPDSTKVTLGAALQTNGPHARFLANDGEGNAVTDGPLNKR